MVYIIIVTQKLIFAKNSEKSTTRTLAYITESGSLCLNTMETLTKDTIQKKYYINDIFLAVNDNFATLSVYFQPLKRGHLPIKDNNH